MPGARILSHTEVHMLSNHSFNVLLKTMEEPPISSSCCDNGSPEVAGDGVVSLPAVQSHQRAESSLIDYSYNCKRSEHSYEVNGNPVYTYTLVNATALGERTRVLHRWFCQRSINNWDWEHLTVVKS